MFLFLSKQPDFLGQSALRTDAVAVADDEYPDHEFRVDRRTPDAAVVRCKFLVQILERHRVTNTLIRRNKWFAGMRSSNRNS